MIKFKMSIFIGTCGLFIGGAMVFIIPIYQQIRDLQQKNWQLNEKNQAQKLAENRKQQLQRDIVSLRHPFTNQLHALQPLTSSAIFIAEIAQLANTYHLKISALQPQGSSTVTTLEQYVLSVEINGNEANLLAFIRSLMHRSRLLEFQKLQLMQTHIGINLHATLLIHYAR